MPIIPGRALVLGALVPLALALAAVPAAELRPFVWLADAILVFMALIDLALVWRPIVSVERRVAETCSLARPVAVTLEVKNYGRRSLHVAVVDALFEGAEAEGLPASVLVEPGMLRRVTYKVTPKRRGAMALGDHFVRYGSLGGLWVRQLTLPAHDTLRVYPDVQAVRHYEMLARQNRDHFSSRLVRMRGGDTEFERLRDYSPDDEFRKIDWKATARRQRLTTREYQLERNQNVVFMLDSGRLMTSMWDGLTALDWSLNATLMLSHVAIRRGDLVGMLAFDDRVRRMLAPRGGVSASNHIIQAAYDLFPAMVETDFEGAFRKLRTEVKRRTLVILISHAFDDPTARRIERLCRELIPQHLPICVLLKDIEVEQQVSQVARSTEEYCVQGAAAEIVLWRDRVISEMQRAGVMVLDVAPKDLTGALVTRYLEVKARGLI